MGIKFNCPNGHKLNVKSFLAGKKGVCPQCGAKFRIPNEPGDDDDDQAAHVPAAMGAAAAPQPATYPAGVATSVAPVAAPVQPAGIAMPVAPAGMPAQALPVQVRPAVVAPVLPMGMPVAVPAQAVPYRPTGPLVSSVPLPTMMPTAMPVVPGPVPPAVHADPIAEAPAAQWYVRPPTGSQYGPARGDVMRKWIAEGRVSSDSLVWREGWADWKNAGQLFPNLAAAGQASATTPSPVDLPVSNRAARTSARYSAKQKGGGGLAIAALVVLGLVCVALIIVLFVVLGSG